MDNYPKHLTPPKDERGTIDISRFAEWWAWAKAEFPTVPENAAQYWLHENWGRSPYGYIKSRNYQFAAVEWPSSRLFELRSEWGNFDPTFRREIKHGKHV